MLNDPRGGSDEGSEVDEFFVESAEHSKLKTTIATKYFFTWARIIIRTERSRKTAYVDLYAGPGRFVDGTKSTPLLVLERAIRDARLREMLATYFNDGKSAHAKSLEVAISTLRGIKTLKHKPLIDKHEVGPRTVTAFQKPHIPTFAFIDPYGYKGLSLGLVNAVIKDWACECLFLFNYNRVNPGINNKIVRRHMEALFGASQLRRLIEAIDRSPTRREALVMAALAEALRALGGRYVVPFRFKMNDAERTSHYLIFVSKKFLGYEIMRDVMAKASSTIVDGVASFEDDRRCPVFLGDGRSPDALAKSLMVDLAGLTMTVRAIFERHSVDKLYVMRNYKDALILLETKGLVRASRPGTARRKGTLADDIRIKFPRLPGRGAKIAASHSTPGHPASGPPPSTSVRPTA